MVGEGREERRLKADCEGSPSCGVLEGEEEEEM